MDLHLLRTDQFKGESGDSELLFSNFQRSYKIHFLATYKVNTARGFGLKKSNSMLLRGFKIPHFGRKHVNVCLR